MLLVVLNHILESPSESGTVLLIEVAFVLWLATALLASGATAHGAWRLVITLQLPMLFLIPSVRYAPHTNGVFQAAQLHTT